MENKVNYVLVGSFVIGLGALLIGAVLWIASGGTFQKTYERYIAVEDESVAGLNVSAPVKYNGVDVGKVRRIALDPRNPAQVRLHLDIERGTPIKVDTVAELKTQGLTGIAYVELDGGALDAPPLRAIAPERYPVIRTKPSLSARLENVLTTVLSKLDRTSSNIDALLSDENRAAFSSTLADLAAVSKTLANRKEALDSTLVSAAKTFENTARLSAQLGPVAERIGRGADSVSKMGEAAAVATASAGKTVDSVGDDVKRFSSESLPALQNLLGELNVLSVSLRRLTEQTERNPSSLIFGSSPIANGPGEVGSEAQRR